MPNRRHRGGWFIGLHRIFVILSHQPAISNYHRHTGLHKYSGDARATDNERHKWYPNSAKFKKLPGHCCPSQHVPSFLTPAVLEPIDRKQHGDCACAMPRKAFINNAYFTHILNIKCKIILPVQVRSFPKTYKKLTRICVGPRISHTQHTRPWMAQNEALI